MKIVAIGGGEIKDRETLKIDRFIVDLAGKSVPKTLFIPTASGDAPGYCDTFDRIYGRLLGCRTDHLLLFWEPADPKTIKAKIMSADIIYVGGGNTLRMMKRWRQIGVDHLLKSAGERGAILSGLSAGAICWHQWGHSDSRSFTGKSEWPYIRVTGLGFAPGIFCPHLDVEKRHRAFAGMVARYKVPSIACDNNAAVFYNDSKAVCLTSQKQARAYIYQSDGTARPYRHGEDLGVSKSGAFG